MNDKKARLIKEQEFHNIRFSPENNDPRAEFSRFYLVEEEINKYKSSLIKSFSTNKRVLEYGCARGENTPFLIDSRAKSIVGIDISDSAISAAKDMYKSEKSVKFYVMDAENTSFDNNEFDLIFGSGILHHLDMNDSLDEIVRILDPDGTIVFYEPLGYNPFINLFRYFTPSMRTPDEHPLVYNDLENIKKRFSSVQITYSSFLTLCLIPFVKFPFTTSLLRVLSKIDNLLFKVPFIGMLAWTCVIRASSPISKRN